MKAIVCGGRDYRERRRLWATMDRLHTMCGFTLIITGGARGADTLAADWALGRCIPCLVIPANWTRDGLAAGPIRNKLMVDEKPGLVVAFPGGIGTADMVAVAKARGILVREVA